MSGMRRFVDLVVKGVLRSRWGLAVVLAVVVLAVVGLGRVFTGPGTQTALDDTGSPAPIVQSTEAHGDDSVISPAPPPAPVTSPGTAAPDAVAYAFASAWVDHRNVTAEKWYGRLLPHATATLAEQLAGVDPAAVPADRIDGRPTIVPLGNGLVDATVNADSGQLRLRLVAPEGRWLVDSVDWERA